MSMIIYYIYFLNANPCLVNNEGLFTVQHSKTNNNNSYLNVTYNTQNYTCTIQNVTIIEKIINSTCPPNITIIQNATCPDNTINNNNNNDNTNNKNNNIPTCPPTTIINGNIDYVIPGVAAIIEPRSHPR